MCCEQVVARKEARSSLQLKVLINGLREVLRDSEASRLMKFRHSEVFAKRRFINSCLICVEL